MTKTIATLIFVFLFNTIHCQSYLDSLQGVWTDNSQSDFRRSDAYVNYIWDGFLYSNPDSALILTKELLDFTIEKNIKSGVAAALNLEGMVYYVIGKYKTAIDKHLASKAIQEEIKNNRGIANSFNNIGIIYNSLGNNLKAIEFYEKSLKIQEEIKNNRGIANSLNNIGIVYKKLGNYLKAIEFFERCLKIRIEINDKKGISDTYNNIGNIYNAQNKLDEALEYYEKSIELSDEINNLYGKAITLNNIADIHYKKEEYKMSLEYSLRSLTIREEIDDKSGIAFSLRGIGQIYSELGNLNKGIEYCLRALKLAQEINDVNEQKTSCSCLYVIYKAKDNGKQALEYHEKMLVFNDSLNSEETAKKLQQMEFSKQVLADSLAQVEKDLLVEMQHKEVVRKKDKNRNLAMGAGVFFLVLSGGFFSRWRYVKKSKAIIEKEKDRSENLLLNILPAEIAEELKEKGQADARDFDLVSILFTDFKGFTQASEKLTAQELIGEINHCFKAFDLICEKYGIEKIKTIGDAYMAAGGLPVPTETSVKNTVMAALEMQDFMVALKAEKEQANEIFFEMRAGVHTGPVVAGIVGVKKFQYDIWGDTVNTASRMESSGEIGKVNISEDTFKLLENSPEMTFTERGKVQAKGKGQLKMYFVEEA